jgi:hypothetical protein
MYVEAAPRVDLCGVAPDVEELPQCEEPLQPPSG